MADRSNMSVENVFVFVQIEAALQTSRQKILISFLFVLKTIAATISELTRSSTLVQLTESASMQYPYQLFYN